VWAGCWSEEIGVVPEVLESEHLQLNNSIEREGRNMLEMIDKIFGDTLWIYTAILGSLLGAAFLAYFKDTKAGLWCYAKFDQLLDFLRDRYGLTWFDQPEDAWRQKYPHVTKKIDELEARLNKLEEK